VSMRRLLLFFAALLLGTSLAHAANVEATLDRSQVQLGETVTLNVRVQGDASIGQPDLGALANDFEILGTSSNRSVSIVNGQRSDQQTYGIALRPRHIGQLQVPSLAIAGSRTAPLALEVIAPTSQPGSNGGKDVFLEATVEPGKAYVGQQLLFTVRLYFAASLSSGALDDPQLPGVDVRRLGDDLNYTAERDGKTWHVIERRYALVPQRAGALAIPPLNFQGEMVDPSDPDSFFGMGSPVSATSPARSVDVQPIPPNWGQSAWLPARALALTLDGLPADGKLRVGQPLNLDMALQATGLPYEALPELSLPTLEGATVYPEKPVNSSKNDGHWILGRRQQGFAVIPQRAGTLQLPATTVKWWNVQAGQPEVARIPAHTLTVLPTVGATAPAPGTSAAAPAPVKAPASIGTTHSPAAASRARSWRWWALGGVALGLLLAAALAWWLRQRRRTAAPTTAPTAVLSARTLRADFVRAARQGTVADQAHALLAWARAERPDLPNLGALADALESPDQRAAIAALQRRQFAAEHTAAPLLLDRVFADGFAWRDSSAGKPASGLPPLYPFQLH
jgi:hypothetical protein